MSVDQWNWPQPNDRNTLEKQNLAQDAIFGILYGGPTRQSETKLHNSICIQATSVGRPGPDLQRRTLLATKPVVISRKVALASEMSELEWQMRVDLAACYRLVALYDMDDLISTHISARVPGPDAHFLLNPYGMLFEQVRASDLIKVDLQGNIVQDTEHTVNSAGFVIHSAVHAARPDAKCVLHTHTVAGMAISSIEDGLLPLTQKSMRFYNRIGYHDYEGVADDLDEHERLVRDLGAHNALILRNHGLLTCGRTVAHAFFLMRNLEKSCKAQLAAMSTGAKLITLSTKLMEHAAGQVERRLDGEAEGWSSLRKKLDRIDPSYRD
jgi:ribulose-5-phosphate 4-epimerase/fuculose-1-phosphate aldolase